MEFKYIEDPCRNFCILSSAVIIDPMDDREKIVLSSFVSGGTGRLIFIDAETEEAESMEIPGDEGAWALLCINNGKLLVGTCGLYGFLHCLDLKTRKWAPSLRDENETYIWNLVLGSDGLVYGGTYPGCVLLCYDPDKHTLKNLGRVSEYPENLYSRVVYGDVPGKIFISCGHKKNHAAVWDMAEKTVKKFGRDGAVIKTVTKDFVCTITDNELDFYDPYTLNNLLDVSVPMDKIDEFIEKTGCLKIDSNSPILSYLSELANPQKDVRLPNNSGSTKTLSNGSVFGIRGQEYFILRKEDKDINLKRIPTEAPPTQIMTIISAPDGKLWGSSCFGQTIFNFNPKDGTYWNSLTVCNAGGEVYGIQWIKGKIFMSAYAGGDHIVYDPSKPWDQKNNINPVTLKPVGPDLIRPGGKSTVGPDGAFWTGWAAKYGTYGGGISRVDPDSLEVSCWYDPVPEQNIACIASGDKYLYFTTDGFGNGLPFKSEPFHLCVWDTAGKIIWKMQFPKGIVPHIVAIVGNYGLVSVGNEVMVFNCGSMEFAASIKLNEPATCIVKYDDDTAAVFSGKDLFFVKPKTGRSNWALKLPSVVKTAAVSPNGDIYFASGSHLYKVV